MAEKTGRKPMTNYIPQDGNGIKCIVSTVFVKIIN